MIVLAVVGWIGARSVVSYFIQRAASGVIHMTNPRFYGKDDEGRSFLVAAKEATRVPGEVDRIILEGPQLNLDLGMFGGDTTWYHMPFAATMMPTLKMPLGLVRTRLKRLSCLVTGMVTIVVVVMRGAP